MTLICAMIGQDNQECWPTAVRSLAGAVDHILCIDGGSNDDTIPRIKAAAGSTPITILSEPYDQHDRMMNGRQRNKYLEYIKKNWPDSWVLVMDADEVASDNIFMLKKVLETLEPGVWNVHMEHLVYCYGLVDATLPKHFTPGRLFKITEGMEYPLSEHPVLVGALRVGMGRDFDGITIWHLAYTQGMNALKKRYEYHIEKSEMHTPKQLRDWYCMHTRGEFPVRKINTDELPRPLREAVHL